MHAPAKPPPPPAFFLLPHDDDAPFLSLTRTQKHNRRRRAARVFKRAGGGVSHVSFFLCFGRREGGRFQIFTTLSPNPHAQPSPLFIISFQESTEDPLLVPSVRLPSGGSMPRPPHSGAAAARAGGGHPLPAAKRRKLAGLGGPTAPTAAAAAADSAVSCGTGQGGDAAGAPGPSSARPPVPPTAGGGVGAGTANASGGDTLTATFLPPPPAGPCRRDMSAIITAALRRGGQAAEVEAAAEEVGAPRPPPRPSTSAPPPPPPRRRPPLPPAAAALDGNYTRYYGYRLALSGGGSTVGPAPHPPSPAAARVAALGGPATADPRLAALDVRSLTRGKAVLDVGCNAGLVGLALAVLGKPASVTGVDIDGALVRDARRHLAAARSAAAGLASDASAPGRARSAGEAAGRALRRVSFRQEDIAASSADDGTAAAGGDGGGGGGGAGPPTAEPLPTHHHHPAGGYGSVFCLSVTKWVHLRGGDACLVAFLARLAALTAPGGHLVLEPQPWSSYERAARKKLGGPRAGGPPLRELVLRPDAFVAHLEAAHGLRLVARRVPAGVAPGFARELLVFKKPVGVKNG